MITLLLALSAVAAPVDDAALAHALQQELARSLELSLPGSPPVYHLRYKLIALEQADAHAAMGGLVAADAGPLNALGVEVRVGDPSFDNTGLGGWRNGFRARTLGQAPTPHAARVDAWALTDLAYKDAVEQLSRKQAQVARSPDHPGDYTLTGPVHHDGGRATSPAGAAEVARELAVQVSTGFADHPSLALGEVHVGHEAGALWVLDSEGTAVRHPVSETSVRALAHVLTADGQRLTDQRLWTARRTDLLPPIEDLRGEATGMAEALLALAEAPVFDGEYVGPVLFEGAAAADLFQWLLLPQLEGTPGDVPFDSFLGGIGGGRGDARMNRRALPSGWRVVDDPAADPGHPGAFTHDFEGTPARPVTLVEDGIVRDLLMSRTPRRELASSNGHGRATLAGRAEGRASLVTITPPRTLPERALRRRALRAAAAYGLDHVLVVRRLQHPSLRYRGDPGASFDDAPLPPPVAVARLYRDGREEVVRGARFVGVERWVLRDLLAAGPSGAHDLLAPFDGDPTGLGPTEGVPIRVRCPTVLVGELEVIGDRMDPARARRLPPPSPVPHPADPREAPR